MAQMVASSHAEVKPAGLILGLIACVGIVFTLITLLFGFTSIPGKLRRGEDSLWRLPQYRRSRTRLCDSIYRRGTHRANPAPAKIGVWFFYAERHQCLPGRRGTGGNRDHDHRRSKHRPRPMGCAVSDYRSKNVSVRGTRTREDVAGSFRERDARGDW